MTNTYDIVLLMMKSGLPLAKIREFCFSYDTWNNDCVQKFRCHRALLFKNFIHRKRMKRRVVLILQTSALHTGKVEENLRVFGE